MGQFYSLLWDACGFWSLTNCGCGLQQQKKPHPAWVFLRKMPEKQLILFAWPYIASYKWNIDKIRLAGCQERRELTQKIWAKRGERTVEFLE